MNSVSKNYEIYDKELLAVRRVIQTLAAFPQGGLHPVTVLCDHKNLEYFMTTKKLTRRQARWSLELSEYDFSLLIDRQTQWSGRFTFPPLLGWGRNVWMDDVPEVILERCKRELKHFRFRDNSFLRILEDGKSTAAYVTTDKRVDVMKHYHTSLAHLKYGSIIDLLLRRFWWPSMKKDLKDFIARCPECQLDRSSSGIHAPLPIRPVPQLLCPLSDGGSISMVLWRDQVREQVFDYLHRLCNSMGFGQASQARSLQCSTKAQSEAMRKRGGFDENTPDYFFKVGDMVKMKHHERLKLELDGKVHIMWWMLDILGLTGS
ncbi:hypothetical protein BASA83_011931 [Batrachochytrium salamandrivorans]|nr:hypothetical protein BASA83_011931 [Batrachochytrium salamandrivorans]